MVFHPSHVNLAIDVGYLAQHPLLNHMPELQDEFLTPDFCSAGEPSYTIILHNHLKRVDESDVDNSVREYQTFSRFYVLLTF